MRSYHYIPINPGTKRPVAEWGGWPINREHENVYKLQDVEQAEHEWFAVVGNEASDLLVLDIDLYKMSDAERSRVERGWFGILEDTRIVKTPSGGLHVYLRTGCEFEDLPRTVDYVDLKGDVGRGYVLSHPTDEYEVTNDETPVRVSEALLRELPVFRDREPRTNEETAEPVISESEIRSKAAAPCLRVLDAEDTKTARRFLSAIKHGRTQSVLVSDVLPNYREGENTEAPGWLHDTPSSTGTNFRVDEGGETFRCWRHDVTGNALHLLAVKNGDCECGDWAYGDVNLRPARDIAYEEGYITQISCESLKDSGLCPIDCGRRHPIEGILS